MSRTCRRIPAERLRQLDDPTLFQGYPDGLPLTMAELSRCVRYVLDLGRLLTGGRRVAWDAEEARAVEDRDAAMMQGAGLDAANTDARRRLIPGLIALWNMELAEEEDANADQ